MYSELYFTFYFVISDCIIIVYRILWLFFFLFQRIEKPFLAAVQDTLGDRYTDNMENIYKITIRYILDTVVKGFDLGTRQSQSNTAQPPKASPEPSPSPQDSKEKDCTTTSQSLDVVKQWKIYYEVRKIFKGTAYVWSTYFFNVFAEYNIHL